MSVLLLFFCALFTASAARAATPSVIDRAHLLSPTEHRMLAEKIAALEEKYGVRIVVGTQKSIHGQAPDTYVDAVIEKYYGGTPGGTILLLVADDIKTQIVGVDSVMRECISCGYGRQYAEDAMRPDVAAGHYAAGFAKYVDAVDEMLAFHREHGRAMTAADESMGVMPILTVLGIGAVGFWMSRVRMRQTARNDTDSAAH
ncbi:hypothetical protein HMPREF9555_02245 [Selenomonas artemidis F0399]|jgi:domain of unknown function (DUF477)|uniref:TPM domain-containing protein n=2 Tax=Selenomonas TaxID=970 RepID=E7N5E9_9FIRM|nr:hypothetical protein HMPREF9555_02245 [Selenomonas artemidis F0399]